MMKKVKAFILASIAIFVLTGCQNDKQDISKAQNNKITVTTNSTSISDNFKPEVISSSASQITSIEENYKEYLNFLPTFNISQEILLELPKVPDWKSEESEKIYIDSRNNIPKKILEEYDRRVLQKDIDIGEHLYLLYGGNNITSVFWDAEKQKYILCNALFSDNGYLVSEYFNSSDRTLQKRVYSDTGIISSDECFVDFSSDDYTLLFTSKKYDLSVVYDENSSELVCLRYYQELGDCIPVLAEDVEEFKNILAITGSFYFRIGYKNEKNELVSPIILNNDGNISFHLIKNEDEIKENYFYSAVADSQEYWIINNSIYCINNLIDTESIGYCRLGYVDGSEIITENIKLDFANFTDIKISQWDGLYTDISASTNEYLLLGGYKSKYSISEMIEKGLFDEYFASGNSEIAQIAEEKLSIDIQEATYYICPNWNEAKKIINESMGL